MLTQPVGAQYERCPKHPQNDIILFCLGGECIEPLCKDCCREHVRWHNVQPLKPELETVDNVRQKCIEDIHKMKVRFEEERAILKHFSDSENGELVRSVHAKLEQVKQNLMNMVTQYCAQLENQIKSRIQQHRLAHPGEKKELHQRLNGIIQSLDNQEKSMLQPRYLRALLLVLTEEKNYELEAIQTEIDGSIRHYLQNMFDVFVHEDRLQKLKIDLQSYVAVEEVNLEQEIEIYTQKLRSGEAVYGVDKFGNPTPTRGQRSKGSTSMNGYEELRLPEKPQPYRSNPSNIDSRIYQTNLADSNKSRLKQKYDL